MVLPGVAVLVLAALPLNPLPRTPVPAADLDDMTVRVGRVTVTNFCLRESPRADDQPFGAAQAGLRFVGSYRNRGDRATVTVVAVGLDADGELVWACTASETAGTDEVGVVGTEVAVPPGTLQRTATVRVRATVTPAPGPSVGYPAAPAR